MNSYMEKNFLKVKVDELVISRGHIPQWGAYQNSKQEYLKIDGVKVAEFNYNRNGFYSYAFNKKCYTYKQFEHLEKYCPVGNRNNAEGWHKRGTGYYGRMMGRNGYTLAKDLQFILDRVTYYLLSIEDI